MDYLPADIVTHIFTFLPVQELPRCSQLNSVFKNLIKDKWNGFRHPKIEIHLKDKIYKVLCLSFVYCKKKTEKIFFVDYSNRQSVKIQTKHKNFDFLGCMSKGNHSLRELFEFFIRKGDIQELSAYSLTDPECFAMLTEAIDNKPNLIRSVSIGPTLDCVHRLCDLLTAVASQSRQVRKTLRILVHTTEFKRNWDKVQKLNDIAALFSSSWFEFGVGAASYVIVMISKHWIQCPFREFNFHLRLMGKEKPLRVLRDDIYIPELNGFVITKTRGEHLLCISPEDVTALIELEEIESGNILEFRKKQEEYRPYSKRIEDTVTFEIIAFLK